MRGKVIDLCEEKGIDGITPAYAGKRPRTFCHFGPLGDHPRVCGEKYSLALFLGLHQGSPPRMRGKAAGRAEGAEPGRITPAYAGKSCAICICPIPHRDHPRVCGEKKAMQTNATSKTGSPPRVRGKAWRLPAAPGTQGITPACAGKSGPISASGRAIRDHPRVCGEKALHDGGILPAQGSPPRVRGKVVVSRNLCLLSGITPACAGKSELQALVLSGQRDHPRVCGEKRRKRQSV